MHVSARVNNVRRTVQSMLAAGIGRRDVLRLMAAGAAAGVGAAALPQRLVRAASPASNVALPTYGFLTSAEMATLDAAEIIARASAPGLVLVLDGIEDPHNLGACLRSADAFGVHAVIIPKDRAVGVNATVAKTASGAADTVPVVSVTNLARAMRDLKERGVWLIGADADGAENLFDAKLSGPLAWVLGAEGAGLRRLTRELCDRIVSIPLRGSVSSLNVSVAAGVCLFETRRQRNSRE